VPNLSFQEREERIVEELKTEMALLRRDLVERLRRIEDYITFLETDIGRLRLDLQRINGKIGDMPTITQTTRSGESRQSVVEHRQAYDLPERQPPFRIQEAPTMVQGAAQPQTQVPQTQAATGQVPVQPSPMKATDRKDGLNPTEVSIIRFLIDNPGTKSATPIAQTIGKAREHVARTLKKLAEEQKIIRDETTWPYTYIVPENVKKDVEQQPSQQTE